MYNICFVTLLGLGRGLRSAFPLSPFASGSLKVYSQMGVGLLNGHLLVGLLVGGGGGSSRVGFEPRHPKRTWPKQPATKPDDAPTR